MNLSLTRVNASLLAEGSTNWNVTANVISNVQYWLMGCRPGSAPIGPVWPDRNWFDFASNMTINNETRCPLRDDAEVRGGDWPLEARKVMQEAGPRQQGLLLQ